MELSQEEFWYNLRLRYGLMLQDIPATFDVFSKKFLIKLPLSCQSGGLVLVLIDNTVNHWGTL